MAKKNGSINRRGFLKGAAAGAAALVTTAPPANAQAGQRAAAQAVTAPQPSAAQLAADAAARPPAVSTRIIEKPGSDFMVDVIKALGIEYVAANPGSSFEGLHESLINYGENKMPELLTCTHERMPWPWRMATPRSKTSRCWHFCMEHSESSTRQWRSTTPMVIAFPSSYTALRDLNIDYAKMAQAYGMYAEGPISDPKELAPALKRGIERVKKGEPVMLDVITQPR